jgi:hypothetical protein
MTQTVPSEPPPRRESRVELSLADAAEYLLQECRVVVPGMQALFGFQLISVFNTGFAQKLTHGEQRLHLAAIILVVAAITLVMTPAAYHRQTGPREMTERLITLTSGFLLWSMWLLALGISLDFYLIARLILDNVWVPVLTGAMFVFIAACWFVLPRVWWVRSRRRDAKGGSS